MKTNDKASSVDEYLAALPDAVRNTLQTLRQTILDTAPDAEELISYQIPTYKYFGALVHFAAFKSHCSFFGASKHIMEIFEKELSAYKTKGTTIYFTSDNPLPAELVRDIVRVRLQENKEKNKAAKRKK